MVDISTILLKRLPRLLSESVLRWHQKDLFKDNWSSFHLSLVAWQTQQLRMKDLNSCDIFPSNCSYREQYASQWLSRVQVIYSEVSQVCTLAKVQVSFVPFASIVPLIPCCVWMIFYIHIMCDLSDAVLQMHYCSKHRMYVRNWTQ